MQPERSEGHRPTVFVVDDDAAIRRSLRFLIESSGLSAETYGTAEEFLEKYDPERPGCLVLDVRMPGISGLHLQEELLKRQATLPIIVVTGYAEVPMAVRALQKGARDFIEKPFSDQNLLEKVRDAIAADLEQRRRQRDRHAALALFDGLTEREREVLGRVIAGKPNKVIAHELALRIKTVEAHRARMMKKLGADSLADVLRLAVVAGWYAGKP